MGIENMEELKPKDFTLQVEVFDDGEYETPVFLHEGEKETHIGVAVVTIYDGELSATIEIDHEVFQNMGFELTFVETNNRLEGRKYSLHAKRRDG